MSLAKIIRQEEIEKITATTEALLEGKEKFITIPERITQGFLQGNTGIDRETLITELFPRLTPMSKNKFKNDIMPIIEYELLKKQKIQLTNGVWKKHTKVTTT